MIYEKAKIVNQQSITNMRLNVLYVIWSLGLGGAERALIYLAKGLDRKKFNPVVCCLNEKGIFAEELEKEEIKVIALNKRGKFDFRVIKKIIFLIHKYQIDIVHTHMWGANLWGRIAAKIAKVPIIIATEQNVDTWKKSLHLVLDKGLSCWTDKIIAVSENVGDFYIKQAGIKPDKIKVIFNPVDLEKYEFSTEKKKEFNLEEEITLGIIGRLVPQKGHRYFLLALKELLQDYKVRGLIIGSGPLEEKLKQFSQRLGLNGNVLFAGLREDIPNLLKRIDILIMPSLREGLPLVALEAMASGVPVIATKVGGNPEVIINAQTGILIEPQNHIAIKEAVIRLINNKDLVQRLIHNSRKWTEEKFSVIKVVQDTQSLYEEVHKDKVRH